MNVRNGVPNEETEDDITAILACSDNPKLRLRCAEMLGLSLDEVAEA